MRLPKPNRSDIFRYAGWTVAGFFTLILLFIMSVWIELWGKIPSKKELSQLNRQRATEVFSADSVLIGKFYLYDRQPIAYSEIPPHVVQALVAIEDERFYDHSGVDVASLFRVAFKSVLLGDDSAGGGSTLTQQLAKNLYPRNERKSQWMPVHKVKEMIMAKRLESLYEKEEIIERYLNTVSFGGNVFGIESASKKFFSKPTKELAIEEGAVLIGMLKATYGYNPRVFPEKSLQRRNLVLNAMANMDYLKAHEKDSLTDVPVTLHYRNFDHNHGLAPYFREQVRQQVLAWNKKEANSAYNIYTDGLKVYTTLDSKMQVLAENSLTQHMPKLQEQFEKSHGKNAPWLNNTTFLNKLIERSAPYKKLKALGLTPEQIMDSLNVKKPMELTDWSGNTTVEASTIDSLKHYTKFLNVGSLSIDPHTGAIKTWIGGIDFSHYKYDHIAQSKRQVGSTFKPILYTAAIESGISPCTYFPARQVTYRNLDNWSPSNSGDKDETYLNYSMEEALSKSVNTVAVKVLEATGIPTVALQAKKMGITTALPLLPSLALGTGEIPMTELASAYTSFVNEGRAVQPYIIERITDSKDSVLVRFKPHQMNEPAFHEETGQALLKMMQSTVNTGTAARLRSTYGLKNDIAGKTGTTQENKDAWFAAITPNLVHLTWVGSDHHEIGFKSTQLGQGANAALPLFALLYQKMNKNTVFSNYTKARFDSPDPLVLEVMDCPPIKEDGFFRRLFKNPSKRKARRFGR